MDSNRPERDSNHRISVFSPSRDEQYKQSTPREKQIIQMIQSMLVMIDQLMHSSSWSTDLSTIANNDQRRDDTHSLSLSHHLHHN